METVSEVRMSGGREFQRLEADLLKALDPPMVVWLADRAKKLDGRRGSDSAGGCVDIDQFSTI